MADYTDEELEKFRSIGILNQPYGKPRYCASEDMYFNSAKEYDDYAKKNNLVPVERRKKK